MQYSYTMHFIKVLSQYHHTGRSCSHNLLTNGLLFVSLKTFQLVRHKCHYRIADFLLLFWSTTPSCPTKIPFKQQIQKRFRELRVVVHMFVELEVTVDHVLEQVIYY